jgi:hypothetical protein
MRANALDGESRLGSSGGVRRANTLDLVDEAIVVCKFYDFLLGFCEALKYLQYFALA